MIAGGQMIFAEIHGKLGSGYSRAHARGEDLLTSTAFGLLRYLPLQDGLLRVLEAVRPLIGDAVSRRADPEWIDLRWAKRCEMRFWPWLRPFGQPDLILELF